MRSEETLETFLADAKESRELGTEEAICLWRNDEEDEEDEANMGKQYEDDNAEIDKEDKEEQFSEEAEAARHG